MAVSLQVVCAAFTSRGIQIVLQLFHLLDFSMSVCTHRRHVLNMPLARPSIIDADVRSEIKYLPKSAS